MPKATHILRRVLRPYIKTPARPAFGPTLGKTMGNDKGLSAVEFAIIAPVLMVFTFGMIVYGFYFATLIGLEQAASEGARAAVRGLTTDERVTLATNAVNTTLNNYGGLIDEVLVTRNIAADPVNPALLRVQLIYDFSAGPFGDFGTFVPLPGGDIEVETVVSNGGF